MDRSLKGFDFYTDDERENSSASISLLEDSSNNTEIHNESVDKVKSPLSHEFVCNHPRASIKMTDATERSSADRDIDVIILEEISKKTDGVEKTSTSYRENFCFENNEPLCIDEEYPGALVVNLDETHCSQRENEDDCSSQSSNHSSAQEIFDLCESVPICYKMKNKLGETRVQSVNNSVPKKNILKKKISKSHDSSQSLLQETINPKDLNSYQGPESYSDKEMNVKKEEIRENKTAKQITSESKDEPDNVMRLWLPLQRKKKKKLFNAKMSQLLSHISDKNHPLHKWQNILTLTNINKLSEKSKKTLVKILIGCLEVKMVRIE